MSESETRLEESVTLSQASDLIQCLAAQESLLLLSPPGVGKSDTVLQAAQAAGLPCRSLLGTQIAPEDVSGVPQIVGERSVFCPPRVLLPESNEPFCLFLDELPACTPDIQKAFYSLLLERRIGEHRLPAGSWVVAAGNRAEDRALVRTLSSALVNRVTILNIRVDAREWLSWAGDHGIDAGIRQYIQEYPNSLLHAVPREPVPFSTPRAWALLSDALRLGIDEQERQELPRAELAKLCRALAGGRISHDDVNQFANYWIMFQHVPDRIRHQGYWGVFAMSISELSLPQRTESGLRDHDATTVGNLVAQDRRSLRSRDLDDIRDRKSVV